MERVPDVRQNTTERVMESSLSCNGRQVVRGSWNVVEKLTDPRRRKVGGTSMSQAPWSHLVGLFTCGPSFRDVNHTKSCHSAQTFPYTVSSPVPKAAEPSSSTTKWLLPPIHTTISTVQFNCTAVFVRTARYANTVKASHRLL